MNILNVSNYCILKTNIAYHLLLLLSICSYFEVDHPPFSAPILRSWLPLMWAFIASAQRSHLAVHSLKRHVTFMVKYRQLWCQSLTVIIKVYHNNWMTILFTELTCIILTALYRTFSTSHGIEFTMNDRKIFYGSILLRFTVCNHINYVFFKSVGIHLVPECPPPPREEALSQWYGIRGPADRAVYPGEHRPRGLHDVFQLPKTVSAWDYIILILNVYRGWDGSLFCGKV